jgi:alcohol oxidase
LTEYKAIDVAGKIRPTDSEVGKLGPEFQTAWDTDYKDKPERPMMLMGVVSRFALFILTPFHFTGY